MRPPLSVVVPTRDRPELLDGCLAALAADLASSDEVVVADSASADGSRVAAIARRHGAQAVRLDVPGASRARNAGWRATRHDVVAFVDDDVRVRPGWADAVARAMSDGTVAFLTGRVDVPAHQAGTERPVAVKTDPERLVLHPGLTGNLGASANLAVRRSALEAVGGFDDRMGPGQWPAAAEDLDLYDRLFAAGHRGVYEPTAEVEHEQWRSKRQLVRLDWGYGKGMGVRLARLLASDPRRARRRAREALWEQGVIPIVRDLRKRYEFGALTVAVRTVGTVVGLVAGVLGVAR